MVDGVCWVQFFWIYIDVVYNVVIVEYVESIVQVVQVFVGFGIVIVDQEVICGQQVSWVDEFVWVLLE